MIAIAEPRPMPFSLHSLREGIYLEHQNKWLEWFCTHREARGKLGMEMGRPDKATLAWHEVLALGGLPVQIAGKFVADVAREPDKRTLRVIEFKVYKQEEESVDGLYKRVKAHLRGNLGEPTLEYDGEAADSYLRSFTEWDSDDVMMMWKIARTEAGEECLGEIWCKPLPKEYLKLTLTSC